MTPDDNPVPAAARPDDPPAYYRSHVFVCTNVRPDGHPRGCCKAKGSEKLRDYMKARAKELGLTDVRINTAGCLDRCELGPTMVIYPEGVWYAPRTPADVDEILQRHVRDGGRVARLMLKPGDDPPKAKG
jgi:(2Fe-2S) ferredoxin